MRKTEEWGDEQVELDASAAIEEAKGNEEKALWYFIKRSGKRIAVAIGGFTIVIVGLILVPLPGPGWLIVFGGLALLPAIGVFFLARKLWWRLGLYENGFVLVRGRKHVVRWDDVRSVFAGGLNIDQEVEFILNDGKRLKVDNSFKYFDGFSEAARAGVPGRLSLPQ